MVQEIHRQLEMKRLVDVLTEETIWCTGCSENCPPTSERENESAFKNRWCCLHSRTCVSTLHVEKDTVDAVLNDARGILKRSATNVERTQHPKCTLIAMCDEDVLNEHKVR